MTAKPSRSLCIRGCGRSVWNNATLFDLDRDEPALAEASFREVRCRGYIASVGDFADTLTDDERAYVQGVAPRRALEFSSGRRVAREALRAIDSEQLEVGREGRRPVWPTDVVGTISHTRVLAAAAVCRRGAIAGLGLDLERDHAVSEEVGRRIMVDAEWAWCEARDPHWRSMVFGAKEAIYKAVNPIVGEFIEFEDVEIKVDEVARTFSARCVKPKRSQSLVASGQGYFEVYRDHWLSLFVVPPS